MLNVVEPLADVASSLDAAAKKPGTLAQFTSAAFLSGVSDQVYVNPAHVTMVAEMPGEAPPAGATQPTS